MRRPTARSVSSCSRRATSRSWRIGIASGTLPAVRAATGYAPDLPPILEPGASWEGEISARGALVAGSWARVVFGTLVAVGKPPEELDEMVVWITDNAYQLER